MYNKAKDGTVDLRSDTLTKPTPEMRRAIAEAEVGDDMYYEDPTTNLLQERVAEILGKEAAIFMPTGSMSNQACFKVHTQAGDDVLMGQNSHSWLYESGGIGVISGAQISILPGDGRFTADAVRQVHKPDNHHMSPTTVVSVENTHNFGGGLIWDEDELLGVLKAANELGLAKHLDGARLWHAAVATGKSEAELAQGFDTVAVCLSKGLGCPIGSLVAGSEEVVHKVHRVRNILGGSMRQVGIIAAAGLYAIDNHRDRLAEDHDNATLLAEGFNGLPGLTVNLENVHTNLIMVDVGEEIPGGAPGIAEAAAARGIMFTPLGPERFRMVTHLDVNREQCTQAIEVVSDILSAN